MSPPAERTRSAAYRVLTPRLLLRCWNPEDAPGLERAVTESLEHLRPWMPWVAREPIPVHERAQGLRKFRAEFDLDSKYVYAIFHREGSEIIGSTGLHPRLDPTALEIGYWLHPAAAGRGLATEATAAMTRVGFELLGLQRIEIHCDPLNTRSAAVARRLGYAHEATLQRRLPSATGELRDSMIWTLFADTYPRSAAAQVPVEAYDVLGQPLPLRVHGS